MSFSGSLPNTVIFKNKSVEMINITTMRFNLKICSHYSGLLAAVIHPFWQRDTWQVSVPGASSCSCQNKTVVHLLKFDLCQPRVFQKAEENKNT